MTTRDEIRQNVEYASRDLTASLDRDSKHAEYFLQSSIAYSLLAIAQILERLTGAGDLLDVKVQSSGL